MCNAIASIPAFSDVTFLLLFSCLLFFCSFQFIQTDEAYSLADRGGDAFSDEAVRTLLTEAENNRTDFFC